MAAIDRDYARHVTFIEEGQDISCRDALKAIEPRGFYIRQPPKPHELDQEITDDSQLFQTIHMGAAVVAEETWRLLLDGMVDSPFSISFAELKSMPKTTITAFHECYGSPVLPPDKALWRVGNVQWTGVRLADLIRLANPKTGARYVWSQGLEWGSFANVTAKYFEKDITMQKAMQPENLIAYEINGRPLDKNRGGPVRLVVPGWFGTNSTKWLCHLTLQDGRATGPFTTKFYNEIDPNDPSRSRMRPVWMVEPNSMIVRPKPGEVLPDREVEIWGRAWGCEEIKCVDISVDDGHSWISPADVHLEPRTSYEWQLFRAKVLLEGKGKHHLVARAKDRIGNQQPLSGRRNHVHRVDVYIS
ncbi:hypothetical protein LTR84_010301 [Exophiala bonariae]|uniref:Sulfite oxidase n=1 Tax=Exophiala bonariae TaxID=1690606 RepID=A0AAV9MTH8_9EURO|nr:hypothetical protein LTR84_010301 [Exophiala bonariae]